MINRYQGIKAQVCQKHSQPILAYQKEIPFCSICLVEQQGMVPIDEYNKKLDEILFKENQENDKQLQLLQQLLNELLSYQINLNKHLEKIIVLIKEQINVIERQSEQFQNIIDQTQNQQKLLTQLEKELKNKQEGNSSIRQIIQKSLHEFLQKYKNLDQTFQLLRQTQQQINIAESIEKQQSDDTRIEQLETDKILNPIQGEIIEGNISQQVQQSDKLITQNQIPEQKQDIQNNSQLAIESGKELIINNQFKYRKFQYEKISDATIKETTWCYSFAFNQDATMLFIGRKDNKIKVYKFQNGKIIKEIQTLSNHTNLVGCLVFLKKWNSLVSGSDDKSIIIWNQDQNNSWQPQQILQGHTGWISCMIINEDEDLLISGSSDKTIKFWKKVDLSWSCSQTIDVSFIVQSLSLNTSQTKLISCGNDNNIKVIEHQPDQQWIISQTIKVDQWGYRLCFINDNQFVFQPRTNGFLEIYNYEQVKKQFIKAKQVQVQSCKDCYYYFPCQFIESKNILIVKHGKHVNFFGIDQNGDYVRQQSIQFGDETHQFGRLTDDGQFLVTWDYGSKEIQVRKLSYLE